MPIEKQPLTENEFKKEYAYKKVRYANLVDEVSNILRDDLRDRSIKIDNIESRVKDIDSILQKCANNNIVDPWSLVDIAGIRIVCLFRSQLTEIRAAIENLFEVVSLDDKLNQSDQSFGYMSIHIVCRLPVNWTGPRYDQLKGLQFEIQLRTLAMHAWAAISHYVEYKGEWDVPSEFRKALSALSALFYLADTQFEQFYFQREKAKKHPAGPETRDQEINLDTVTKMFRARFPDRDDAPPASVSQFVNELKLSGFTDMTAVEATLDSAKRAANEYEAAHPPHGRRGQKYADVGIARAAMTIASDNFLTVRMAAQNITGGEYKQFRHLLD